ncbi:hypothetical protein MXB_3868, partial [Myxobolus squamalis]
MRRVVKTPVGLVQDNLILLWLIHISVHAWVGNLIYLSFQSSVEVKRTKSTHNLLLLGMTKFEG